MTGYGTSPVTIAFDLSLMGTPLIQPLPTVELRKKELSPQKLRQLEQHQRTQTQSTLNQAHALLHDTGDESIKKFQNISRKAGWRNKPCPCGSNKKFKKCCW